MLSLCVVGPPLRVGCPIVCLCCADVCLMCAFQNKSAVVVLRDIGRQPHVLSAIKQAQLDAEENERRLMAIEEVMIIKYSFN